MLESGRHVRGILLSRGHVHGMFWQEFDISRIGKHSGKIA
jgi:hypothetical protein